MTIDNDNNLELKTMSRESIVKLCKKNKLYITPRLNDILYLHFQGYRKIENLDEYTSLKCLWLESNAITEISGLNNQPELKCLFLQNNLIQKIENLEFCRMLDNLNLANNNISRIENCSFDILPMLTTLNISNNYIKTLDGIMELKNCHMLSVLDLSNNRIEDILIVKILSEVPELRFLTLTGNPVVNEIPSYRKTMINECRNLTYLDNRPVFPKDRACAKAWRQGGYQEERLEHLRWVEMEREKMLESVRATLKLRQMSDVVSDLSSDNGNDDDSDSNSQESSKDSASLNCFDDLITTTDETEISTICNDSDCNCAVIVSEIIDTMILI